MSDSTTEENPVDQLADEFVRRCRNGERPEIAEYLSRYPDLADEINDIFPSIALLEELKGHRLGDTDPAGEFSLATEQPEQIGDFRILREVGRGGMGVVYEAEQQSLGRRVALKVLPSDILLTETQVQRFQRESQAASKLHHTNIVPVFGVGKHDGFHYYVMQFIDGLSLDKVIRALPLVSNGEEQERDRTEADAPSLDDEARSIAQRVRADHWRFVARIGFQATQAIQYAHEQGTFHRDIKPANLILDGTDTVWITDFGLAKHQQQDDLTRTGDIVGTVRYMAPEQLKGEYDARSDVHSLGLTLYELVALRPARNEETRTALIRQVLEDTPPRPRKLNPEVPVDLETIILKAIAREPHRRYQTAGEFAEDLASFMEGRPIRARKTTGLERCWLWARRNPALASTALLAALLLMTTAVVGWTGYVRTRAALGRAESNLGLAMEAFEDVFTQLGSAGGLSAVAAEEDSVPEYQPMVSAKDAKILENLLQFYDRFAAQNQGNARLQLETARANQKVGQIQNRLGQFEKAESALLRALSIYEQAAEGTDGAGSLKLEVARTLNELSHTYQMTARFGEARESCEKALESLNGLEAGARSEEVLFAMAQAYQRMSAASRFGRAPNDPGHYIEGAARLLEKLVAEHPDCPAYRHALAISYRDRAMLSARQGKRDPGRECLRKAVGLLRDLVEQYPSVPDYRFDLIMASTHGPPGFGQRFGGSEKGNPQSKALCLEALTHAEELAKAYPTVPAYKFALAQALQKVGGIHQAGGEAEQAETLLRRASEVLALLIEESPDVMVYRVSLVHTNLSLADLLRESRRPEEARDAIRQSIRTVQELDQEPIGGRMKQRILSRLYQLLHQVLTESGDEEGARKLSEKIAELRPDSRDGDARPFRQRGNHRPPTHRSPPE